MLNSALYTCGQLPRHITTRYTPFLSYTAFNRHPPSFTKTVFLTLVIIQVPHVSVPRHFAGKCQKLMLHREFSSTPYCGIRLFNGLSFSFGWIYCNCICPVVFLISNYYSLIKQFLLIYYFLVYCCPCVPVAGYLCRNLPQCCSTIIDF